MEDEEYGYNAKTRLNPFFGNEADKAKKCIKQHSMATELSIPQGHTILLSQFFKLSHNTVRDTWGTFITRHQNLLPKAYAVNKMSKGYKDSSSH